MLDNARYLKPRAARARLPRRRGSAARRDVTPIVPVLVGDDWKAVLLWRALYDAGVYVNVALHPAVPPGGALLRTSVMATHDRADAGPRAGGIFADVKADFEAEHGPFPERRIADSPNGNASSKKACSLRVRRVVER